MKYLRKQLKKNQQITNTYKITFHKDPPVDQSPETPIELAIPHVQPGTLTPPTPTSNAKSPFTRQHRSLREMTVSARRPQHVVIGGFEHNRIRGFGRNGIRGFECGEG